MCFSAGSCTGYNIIQSTSSKPLHTPWYLLNAPLYPSVPHTPFLSAHLHSFHVPLYPFGHCHVPLHQPMCSLCPSMSPLNLHATLHLHALCAPYMPHTPFLSAHLHPFHVPLYPFGHCHVPLHQPMCSLCPSMSPLNLHATQHLHALCAPCMPLSTPSMHTIILCALHTPVSPSIPLCPLHALHTPMCPFVYPQPVSPHHVSAFYSVQIVCVDIEWSFIIMAY